MNWSKKVLAEGDENCSNVSKTNEKQVLEGGVENCANVSKTIGGPGFEDRGVDTCAQQ